MDKIIEVEGLNFKYDERLILNDAAFDVEPGSFVSIIGPNGSGKTTLLKNISGVLRPLSGSITLKGRGIEKYKKKELARIVAYVPQSTTIDFGFTVEDIVMMGRSPYMGPFGSETIEDIRIAEASMKLVGIYELKDKKINEISGGEKQRAIIACALAQKPEIILMDEPVSNLDIQHQIKVLNLVKKLCEEQNMTAIVVLHDLNLSSEYSDNIILMKDGRIEKAGSPDEIINEDNIKRVYNTDTFLIKSPVSGRPYIIPVTGRSK